MVSHETAELRWYRITCHMPGGYQAAARPPGRGISIAGDQVRDCLLLPEEAERLRRSFPHRPPLRVGLTVEDLPVLAVPPPPPKLLPPAPAAPPQTRPGVPPVVTGPEQFGHPVPRYDRDREAGAAELAAAIDLEQQERDRTEAEYAAAATRLKRPIRVATMFRQFGLGGAEWSWGGMAAATDPAVCHHRLYLARADCELPEHYRAAGLDVAEIEEHDCPTAIWTEAYQWGDVVEFAFPTLWRDWPPPPDGTAFVATKGNLRDREVYETLPRRPDLFLPVSPAALYHLGDACPDVPRVVITHGAQPGRRGVSAIRKSVRKRLAIPNDAPVCVWVGRLGADEKGVPLLRQAIEQTPQAMWLVVGYWRVPDSPEARAWGEFVAAHETVRWVRDAQPWEVRSYLLAADIGVSTSATEGLSLAVLDATAAGLPVVATDSGGSRHVVVPGANGYLSAPGREADFLRQLWRTIDEPDTWRDLGRAGMQLVQARFDPVLLAKRRVVEYAALVNRPKPLNHTWKTTTVAPNTTSRHCTRCGIIEITDDSKDWNGFCLPYRLRAAEALRKLMAPVAAPPAWDLPQTGHPLRIAFVTQAPITGGLVWRAAQTALGLQRMGHDVKLFYSHGTERAPDLLPWVTAAGLDHYVGAGVYDALLAWAPAVVQCAWPPAGDFPEGPWQRVGWYAGPGANRSLAQSASRDLVTRWILVSEAMRAYLPADLRDRATVIRNAIPATLLTEPPDREAARRALGLRRHEFAVLWAGGRLNDSNKGQERARAIIAEVPHARLLLAGDAQQQGVDAAAIRASVQTMIIDGLRPWEMPWLYAAADAYLQVSHHEGLSVALLEAAHAGLPVVASLAGGTAELVGDRGGYCFAADRTQDAVAGLRYLRDHPEEGRGMGRALQARVRAEYDWGAYLAAYDAMYREVADAS